MKENSILTCLEKTTEQYKSKTAVDDGNICMSWGELTKLSRRLGTALSQKTHGNKPIAIIMEKSAWAVVAIFGTLYAGCFYSIIDPAQPTDRLRKILQVLMPELIVTNRTSQKAVEQIRQKKEALILEDLLWEEEDMEILQKIRKNHKETDILYCMFTSGSTGTPKGVLVTHEAVVRFISHFVELFGITEKDRLGNQAPFDFDVSVKDIYSCVFTGASLIIIPQKLFVIPARLLDYMWTKKVSVLIWAVSALTLISSLKGFSYRIPKEVKKVLFSGEVMPVRQLNIWQNALPEAEFVNLYGPTEITCNCTYFRIGKIYSEMEIIPIGRPFPGREIILRDEKGLPIRKKNRKGEICVTGESLSNGYVNAPEETRRSFVIADDGQMYYNTGDLGYVGSDDQLYYAGRKDDQIKIMGRRIEPGEIESVLNRTDGVEVSCCIPDIGHKRLAAFFSGEIDAVELQRKLAQSLPAYMIPGKLICLERMPLNEHGKIDRMKLRAYLEMENHKT